MRRQHKARRDRRHLMQLPDYLLRDIGMSRIEVDAMTAPDDRRRFVVPARHRLEAEAMTGHSRMTGDGPWHCTAPGPAGASGAGCRSTEQARSR
jgi:hypothetical protein